MNTKKFSFIFAGSSTVSLKSLQLLLHSPQLQLKGLLSQPDRPKGRGLKKQSSDIKNFALGLNIPCWTPKTCKDPSFLKEIEQKKADFCFVCAYGQILPKAFLQLFPNKCLNLHFSLLPKWRGAAPVQQVLMAGDKITGVCLQVMSQQMDAGDIICCSKFSISNKDNAQSVFQKSLEHTKEILKKSLIPYLEGRIKPKPQDHSQASYANKIDSSMARIDWNQTAQTIHNQIRALVLGPQAFSFVKGKRLKIYQSEILPNKELSKLSPKPSAKAFKPGEICWTDKNRLYVQCREGLLSLLELQKEGKKRQKLAEFLKGFPLNSPSAFE